MLLLRLRLWYNTPERRRTMLKEEFKETFRKNLQEARTEKHLTPAEWARKTGFSKEKKVEGSVSQQNISRYEKPYEEDQTIPTIYTAYILASALGISLDGLCGYDYGDNRFEVFTYADLITCFERIQHKLIIERMPVDPNRKEITLVIKNDDLYEYCALVDALRIAIIEKRITATTNDSIKEKYLSVLEAIEAKPVEIKNWIDSLYQLKAFLNGSFHDEQ